MQSRSVPARKPRLDFMSTKATRSEQPVPFLALGGLHSVEVRGGLSAGRAGWSLTARLHRFRRILHLWVTARQVDAAGGQEVEDHNYIAILTEIPSGRYRLRVSHVYVPWGEEFVLPSLHVFDQVVTVE